MAIRMRRLAAAALVVNALACAGGPAAPQATEPLFSVPAEGGEQVVTAAGHAVAETYPSALREAATAPRFAVRLREGVMLVDRGAGAVATATLPGFTASWTADGAVLLVGDSGLQVVPTGSTAPVDAAAEVRSEWYPPGQLDGPLFPACTKRGACGFVDATGQWAVDASLLEVAPFAAGRAAVRFSEDESGWIDASGAAVGGRVWLAGDADASGHALALVAPQAGEDDRLRGELVVTRDGAAHATVGRGYELGQGARRDDAFHDGIARVWAEEVGFGWLRSNGTWLRAPEGSADGREIGVFADGRAVIFDGDRLGYADATGAVVIPTRFDAPRSARERRVADFSEQRAFVRSGESLALIDTSGAILGEGFEDAEPFRFGYARVRRAGRVEWIDATGALVAPK